jgi:hypothetical protein
LNHGPTDYESGQGSDWLALIAVDRIYENQQVTTIQDRQTVDLHMGIFAEFAYRLPTNEDAPCQHNKAGFA